MFLLIRITCRSSFYSQLQVLIVTMLLMFGKQNQDILHRLRSNPLVCMLKSKKRMSQSLCNGGLSIHFLFKALGMAEMRNWAHKDVEWHSACWLWNVPVCEKHAGFFHLTNQCKARNQRSVFWGLYNDKQSNLLACPSLTVISWLWKWNIQMAVFFAIT